MALINTSGCVEFSSLSSNGASVAFIVNNHLPNLSVPEEEYILYIEPDKQIGNDMMI